MAAAIKAAYAELLKPEEQRKFTPALVCQHMSLDLNNLNSNYYVKLLGDEADVHYPKDVLEEMMLRGNGSQVPVTPPSGNFPPVNAQPFVQQATE